MEILYEASAPEIHKVIEKGATGIDKIMAIAHNLGFSLLLHHLQPDSPLYMPTSCACMLREVRERSQVQANMPLIAFLTPKLLIEGSDKSTTPE